MQKQPKPKGRGPEIFPLVADDIKALLFHPQHEGLRESMLRDLESRKQEGITNYGAPLKAWNDRDVVTDAFQEIYDLLVYLKQWIVEDGVGAQPLLKVAYQQALSLVVTLKWAGMVSDALELSAQYMRVGVAPVALGHIANDMEHALNELGYRTKPNDQEFTLQTFTASEMTTDDL